MSAYRENDGAPGEALHPSLALANSSRNSPRGPVDELASPGALRAWLVAHAFEVRGCDVGEVAAFRELRAAVRELLLARIERRLPEHQAVAVVNRASAEAPSAPQLRWDAGNPREVSHRAGDGSAAAARAAVAADAISLLTGAAAPDLRACAAPGCVRLLLRDHPRRQWCSTRCGDRVRASRYYHRHRPTADDPPSPG